jgi:hypothetical protein
LAIDVPSDEPGEAPRLSATTAGVGRDRDGPTVAAFTYTPGIAALRLSAQDAAGRVLDKWTARLEVPDFASVPVALATPRFYRAQTFQAFRQLQAASDRTPVASRTFRRTDRILVELSGVAGQGGPPTISVQLLGGTGQLLAEMPLPAAVGGQVTFELPVGRIAPGTYVLRVRATSGEHTAELLEAFKIVS